MDLGFSAQRLGFSGGNDPARPGYTLSSAGENLKPFARHRPTLGLEHEFRTIVLKHQF